MRSFFHSPIAILVMFFLLPFLLPFPCTAEIIKYQDEAGRIHFTSDPANIPEGVKILKVFSTDQENTGKSEEEELERQPAQEPPLKKFPNQDKIITQVLEDIIQVYQVTHTYSKKDFFVCADMALDVWNIVETKGINARIGVGSIQNPHANWRDFNHAWVVAEVSPNRWLALEPTMGTIVHSYTNRNYYRGFFFDTPREFKEYVDLKKQVQKLSFRTKALQEELQEIKTEYEQELKKYHDLVETCEKKFPDRRISKSRLKKYLELRNELSEQAIVVKELEGRGKQLQEIIDKNIDELKGLEKKLDQPIEYLKTN